MNYEPWDHQFELYEKIVSNIEKGIRSQIGQLPTRGGKSWVAAKLIEDFAVIKKMSVYFVAHTKILIDQMSNDLEDHGIKHSIIAPWAPQLKYRVQVISKDSLIRRLHKMKASGWESPSLIIVDECHLSMSRTYRKILDEFPKALLVGLTATPTRLDGKGLGEVYDELVVGPSIKDLQERKRLCHVETFWVKFDQDKNIKKISGDYSSADAERALDKPKLLANIVNHWSKIAKNKKTLAFCVSIDHAEHLAKQFINNGVNAVAISSRDGKEKIKEKLDMFYSGQYLVLCSVNLFLMGFTVKDCECIIQARPTCSLMIYLQSLGRGMMYIENKILINIDAVNNIERHGLPDDEREWSLDGVTKNTGESKYKRCPDCLHPVAKSARVCPHCGHQWTETAEAVERIPEETEGQLVSIKELQRMDRNKLVLEIARKAHSLKQAISIAKLYGVDDKAAWYIWTKELKNRVKAC